MQNGAAVREKGGDVFSIAHVLDPRGMRRCHGPPRRSLEKGPGRQARG